jgi:hypothetical protein
MPRSFYRFTTFDQNDFNWLTRVTDKDGDGYGVRFQFLSAFCPSCGKFNQDAVFEKGFENTCTRIRVRKGRNILVTDDGFLCVSSDLLKSLHKAGAKGFESKPLYTGMYWHVLRITNRRSFDPKVYRTDEKPCPACQRSGDYGLIQNEREIDLPKEDLTFFSIDRERGQGGYDLFVTEKLSDVLHKSGAKGGDLYKLWTAEEEQRLKDNPKWRRKDGGVSLGQHRYGPTE